MCKDIDFGKLGFRTREEFEFPKIINIEVYRGDCFCNCVHCPVGITESGKRQKKFGKNEFDIGLYKKIIGEISHYQHSTVRLHSVGEPILWKNLVEALKFTNENNVNSWLFTCAVTNDYRLLEAICANTDVVEVSVNSTNPEDYKATKGINAFELVSENIRRMHDYVKEKKLSVRLLVSRVESLDKASDKTFVNYWKSSGMVNDAFVRSYHTYNDMIPELSEIGKDKHEACLVHWARFNISVDGFAVVCFNELFKPQVDSSLKFGDVRQQSIEEIWHGHKLTALREAELNGDYSALHFGNALPCNNCYSCQPLSGDRQTSEYQLSHLRG